MTVVDLHPEDLLDRDARGELSPAEIERFGRHLAQCAPCRLERQARDDFRNERDPDDGDFDVQRLLSEVLAPGTDHELLRTHATPRRSKRRRAHPFLLVAAALFVAGASAAAGWNGIRAIQQRALGPAVPAAVAPTAHEVARGAKRASPGPVNPPLVVSPEPEILPSAPPARVAPVAVGVASGTPASRPVEHFGPTRVAVLAAPAPTAPGLAVAALATPVVETVPAPQAPDAAALFERANKARRAENRGRAEELYRALIDRYPSSAEAHESQALLGHTLLEEGDARVALGCFDEYLRGGGSLAEDVMADRAVVLGRLGRSSEEGLAWDALLHAYPGSVHAERAHGRLRELRGL